MASAAPNPFRLRYYDHSGTACASISTTAGTTGYYKTSPPNSVTGMAFNGTNLLFSCWGDNTITAIRPSSSATIFAKDTTFGVNGIYRVTGLTGIGGIDWDAEHNVLWACNLSAFTGTNKKLGSDLGYIRLGTGGVATFTHFATATHGCVNGVDYNPLTDLVSASGAKLNASTQTVDQFPVQANLTPGPARTFVPGTLTPDGYVAGIEYTTRSLYLADNHGGTKTVQFTTDFVTSTRVTSSTARRFEDLACDPVTFAPQTVVWVEWFSHNQALPLLTNDTCAGTGPPPASLSVTQDQPAAVTANSSLSFTVHVTNPGTATQTGVTVTDTPPANTIFGSATASQGGPCTGTTTVTCPLGSLAAGASATVTVSVTPIQPGTVTNTASARSDQASPASSSRTATVNAEAGITYVSVSDTGFAPANKPVPLGGTVQYNFFGSSTHTLTDAIGLFNSGPQTPVSFVRHTFGASASYTITDSPSAATGIIGMTPQAPATATTGVPFTVTWAAQPIPAGYDEDVQVQLPGTTTWVSFAMNQTTTSGTYTPAGPGTYKFRARLQHTGGTATAYSAATSVAVT